MIRIHCLCMLLVTMAHAEHRNHRPAAAVLSITPVGRPTQPDTQPDIDSILSELSFKPINDYEFLRRSTLDILGRPATPEEIEKFLEGPKPSRRNQWCDWLISQSEYRDYWSRIWVDIMKNGEQGVLLSSPVNQKISSGMTHWGDLVRDLLSPNSSFVSSL